MIHRLGSDLASFKDIEFKPGLNILPSPNGEGGTGPRSGKGSDETGLVELIHFLFGADVRKGSVFNSKALKPWNFEIVFDIAGAAATVSRGGGRPEVVRVNGLPENSPIPPLSGRGMDFSEMSNGEWSAALGNIWFGLPASSNDRKQGFHPSFQRIFPYFARRHGDGGFRSPTRHSIKQRNWSQQVSVSHLLGLDWSIPRRFEELRSREKIAREIWRSAESGSLGRFFGETAVLRTKLAIAKHRAKQLREKVDAFEVVPEYKELESEANAITAEIDEINGDNLMDARSLKDLEASLSDDETPGSAEIEKLFSEANVLLPDRVWRRVEEVERFHRAITENRRAHMADEIASKRERMAARSERVAGLDTRRGQIMAILEAGGALEHYTALRGESARAEAEAEALRQRMEAATRLEKSKSGIAREREELFNALRNDIDERWDIVREAILAIESLSESLCEKVGGLTVYPTMKGIEFEFKSHGRPVGGAPGMRIFCFDLMLAEITARRGRGPGFLIHDGRLFDGVGGRHVARALQLGAERAEAVGFQYIVIMNPDALPRDGFGRGFDVHDHVVDVEFSDATDSRGLFGLGSG